MVNPYMDGMGYDLCWCFFHVFVVLIWMWGFCMKLMSWTLGVRELRCVPSVGLNGWGYAQCDGWRCLVEIFSSQKKRGMIICHGHLVQIVCKCLLKPWTLQQKYIHPQELSWWFFRSLSWRIVSVLLREKWNVKTYNSSGASWGCSHGIGQTKWVWHSKSTRHSLNQSLG